MQSVLSVVHFDIPSQELVLAWCRALGFLAAFPSVAGVPTLPQRFMLTFLFTGCAVPFGFTPILSAGAYPVLCLTEIGIGFLIGVPLLLSFALVELFFELHEFGRGMMLQQAYSSEGSEGLTAAAVGAKAALLAALAESGFLVSWFGQFVGSSQISGEVISLYDFGSLLLPLLFESLQSTLLFFLPFGLLFCLSDLAVGFFAKISPGLHVYQEMLLLKFTLSLIVFLSLGYTPLLRFLLSLSGTQILPL